MSTHVLSVRIVALLKTFNRIPMNSNIIKLSCLSALFLVILACQNGQQRQQPQQEQTEQPQQQPPVEQHEDPSDMGSMSNMAQDTLGKEYTSLYVCPMHCKGSGSDTPGTCPVCGMDYVKNEN